MVVRLPAADGRTGLAASTRLAMWIHPTMHHGWWPLWRGLCSADWWVACKEGSTWNSSRSLPGRTGVHVDDLPIQAKLYHWHHRVPADAYTLRSMAAARATVVTDTSAARSERSPRGEFT